MKTYSQYCPVAHALDLIGERWSLLVVRELMLGQRRYTDLAEALPKIGSNILAARLRDLEQAGIVRRTKLPPPAAVSVYELTEHGRELDGVLRSLAHWGARSLGAPQPNDCWSMYAVQARFRPDAAIDGSYVIRFDDDSAISIVIAEGQLTTFRGIAADATLVVELEPETLHDLIEGDLEVARALARKQARLTTGTPEGLASLVRMFAPAAATAGLVDVPPRVATVTAG